MFLIGYLQEKCRVVSVKGADLKPRDRSQQRRDAGLFHFLVQATDWAQGGWNVEKLLLLLLPRCSNTQPCSHKSETVSCPRITV